MEDSGFRRLQLARVAGLQGFELRADNWLKHDLFEACSSGAFCATPAKAQAGGVK